MEDADIFMRICLESAEPVEKGIGTLGEKKLHAILKQYFEPDLNKHEIKVCGYVADIVNDKGIIEVQTRNLNCLRKKLDCFLKQRRVTVVYPIAYIKYLCWINDDTGFVTKRRKSPKIGTVYDSIRELYKLKPYLSNPNLTICLLLIDMEEYRHLNGWSHDKKKGSTREERIPLRLERECYLSGKMSYLTCFVPESLHTFFTTTDLAKAVGVSLTTAQTVTNILNHIGALVKCGKTGRKYLYKRFTCKL
jgi:hypothetical protein